MLGRRDSSGHASDHLAHCPTASRRAWRPVLPARGSHDTTTPLTIDLHCVVLPH